MKTITQEEPMGCGIARAALVLGKPYKQAKKLFNNPERASTFGFYCKDIVEALNKAQKRYAFARASKKNKKTSREERNHCFYQERQQTSVRAFSCENRKRMDESLEQFPEDYACEKRISKKNCRAAHNG